jgi:hypothetical protein
MWGTHAKWSISSVVNACMHTETSKLLAGFVHATEQTENCFPRGTAKLFKRLITQLTENIGLCFKMGHFRPISHSVRITIFSLSIRAHCRHKTCRQTLKYEGRLKSSLTHLITPSRKFVEVR